jgi:ABC-2 type transport system permease protein
MSSSAPPPARIDAVIALMGALLYLQLTSLRGLILSRLRRLKQPKYLVGSLVGAAYIYFFFVRRTRAAYGNPSYAGHAPHVTPDLLPLFTAVGSLALLTAVVLSWILPRAAASLAFSEAEIAFLFPAPISRRTLIHYRLLKSQLGLAFTSLFLALLSNRWAFLGGSAATHAVGWWIILATLSLHFTGSSFVMTRLRNSGVTPWRPRLVVFGLIGLFVAVTAAWIRSDAHAPRPEDLLNLHSITGYFLTLLSGGPLPWLLAVPKLVLAPFLAPDFRAFALALVPSLLLLSGHYAWVLLAEVSFEQASIERAEKRATRLKATQQGTSREAVTAHKARPARFRLAATGRPETAFLWKNLLATPSYFRPRTVFIAAVAIAAGCAWLAGHPGYRAALAAVTAISLTIAVFNLILGPQVIRNDLRADLPNADILKTYPLRGWQIVLGELLTPIAILTAIVWLALLAAALSAPHRDLAWLGPGERAGIAIGIALLAPLICALQLLVPNTLAVLFPAWIQTVSNRGEHGLDVMGQRIIFLAGQLLITTIALLPAALGAVLVFFAVQWMLGPVVAAVIACLSILATLLVEVWLGMQWLGHRFERFDLSSELRV